MKKRKEEELFENDILKMLKPLFEQEPGQAIPMGAPRPVPGAPQPKPGQPRLEAPPEGVEPGKELAPVAPVEAPAEIGRMEAGAEVQYYSTKDLFTTDYPPNSSEWVNELKAKPWMIPLQDGRVATGLSKLFSTFSSTGPHGAARYSDFQFRVTLRGDLKANTTIKVTASERDEGTAKVELQKIEIPTSAGGIKSEGTNSISSSVGKLSKKGIIDLKAPTEDLIQWATGKDPAEKLAAVKADTEELMSKVYDSAPKAVKDKIEKGDPKLNNVIDKVSRDIRDGKIPADDTNVYRVLFKELQLAAGVDEPEKPSKEDVKKATSGEDVGAKEVEPEEKPKKAPKEKPKGEYVSRGGMKIRRELAEWEPLDDVIEGVKTMKFSKPSSTTFKALQKYFDETGKLPKDETEAMEIILGKRKEKEESINLADYLRSLLLEQGRRPPKTKGEMKAEEGGQVIAYLNDVLFKRWFKEKGAGIAAPTSNRVFEGNMFEWFAASNATFRPKKRDTKTVGGVVELTLTGEIIMESEIWVDARVERRAVPGMVTWTFRVWDSDAPILTKKYKVPAKLKTIGKGPA